MSTWVSVANGNVSPATADGGDYSYDYIDTLIDDEKRDAAEREKLLTTALAELGLEVTIASSFQNEYIYHNKHKLEAVIAHAVRNHIIHEHGALDTVRTCVKRCLSPRNNHYNGAELMQDLAHDLYLKRLDDWVLLSEERQAKYKLCRCGRPRLYEL